MAALPKLPLRIAAAVALAAWLAGLPAFAQTTTPLYTLVRSMPENSWAKANQNAFSDVWVPDALAPLFENSYTQFPSRIIDAWSGFAWDSRRGDLILWGGGHANYSGNEVYRWRSSTLRWERASLPSEIEYQMFPVYHAIDGPDAAPTSAHTYDNNAYLPIADRFVTFGGATYQDGRAFTKYTDASETTLRRTGPYLWNPDRADGNKVGGTTGSHVQRVDPYPSVVGGNMWQNRDLYATFGEAVPTDHVDSCVQVTDETGRETVYFGGRMNGATEMHLYKWTLGATPAQDTLDHVGAYWDGAGGQTTCGYWLQRKLFVYTSGGATPLYFWDLTTPGPTNYHRAVDPAGLAPLIADLAARGLSILSCALKFDPNRGSFAVWCGDAALWRIQPPATNSASGWSVQRVTGGGTPPVPNIGTGILGKWRYAPDYDVFVGLMNSADGSVWIYKPAGWIDPGTGQVNTPPTVAPTATPPTARVNAPITFAANATDGDGTVTAVAWSFGDGQTASGSTVTRSFGQAGAYSATATATDNGGATASGSLVVTITANAPPTLSANATPASVRTGASVTFAAIASDSDGTIASIVWTFSDGQTASGATVTRSFAQPGTYAANVTATDNEGATALRTLVVTVVPNAPPTVSVTASPTSTRVHAPILFSANATDADGSIASIVWTFSDGQTASDASVSHTFAQAGAHTASVVVTDDLGATASATVSVTITPNALPSVAVNATPHAVELWQAVNFAATASDSDGVVTGMHWDFGDGTTASDPHVVHAYAAPGTFVATVTVTDNDGATATASVAITVSAPLPANDVTVVLRQGHLGYAGGSDTFLDRLRPDEPHPSDATLQPNREDRAGVLRFAIFASEGGPVPDGATIVSARLSVYKLVEQAPVYTLHAVLVPWAASEATWNARLAGTPWSTPGALGEGTDVAKDSDAIVAGPSMPEWVTFDVSARVKLWSAQRARGIAANHGWRLAHFSRDGQGSEIASGEASDASLRPSLEVIFHVR